MPKENVLGEVGKGYKISIETLNEGRIGIGAQMIGIAVGALECALAYTGERQQFGKSINQFQGVQFQLAEMATELGSRAIAGLQRRAHERRRDQFRQGSGDGQTVFFARRRAHQLKGDRVVRRLRIREGLSGREVLARFKDRRDLRRHVEHAVANDCEADDWQQVAGSSQ